MHCADYHGSPLPPQDLYKRTQETEGVKKAKLCMHTGTFVFHFKGCVPSPVQCSDRPCHPRGSASEVLSACTKPAAEPSHILSPITVLLRAQLYHPGRREGPSQMAHAAEAGARRDPARDTQAALNH
jgi:hypothetical protein